MTEPARGATPPDPLPLADLRAQAVVLWRAMTTPSPNGPVWRNVQMKSSDEEWKALPAPAYAALVAERDALRRERDEARGLLREVSAHAMPHNYGCDFCASLAKRIDAAVAGAKGESPVAKAQPKGGDALCTPTLSGASNPARGDDSAATGASRGERFKVGDRVRDCEPSAGLGTIKAVRSGIYMVAFDVDGGKWERTRLSNEIEPAEPARGEGGVEAAINAYAAALLDPHPPPAGSMKSWNDRAQETRDALRTAIRAAVAEAVKAVRERHRDGVQRAFGQCAEDPWPLAELDKALEANAKDAAALRARGAGA